MNALEIDLQDLPARTASFLYDAIFLPNAPVPLGPGVAWTLAPGDFKLVGDSNGIIPIKSITFTETQVTAGAAATGFVTLTFYNPLPDDRFTLTVSDSLTDIAGNKLDGESNAAEPNGQPIFPTGNGTPGGDFVARFTVNSRPDIGTWSGGNEWIDTNGNLTWDPTNTDYTNRDVSYSVGYTTDKIFAGDFALTGPVAATITGFTEAVSGTLTTVTVTTAAADGFSVGNEVAISGVPNAVKITAVPSATQFSYTVSGTAAAPTVGGTATVSADGFSKLAAYGPIQTSSGSSFRWLITDNTGAPAITYTPPAALQINGQPIAGDWNPTGTNPAGHDQVGLYDGANWYFFTGGTNDDGVGPGATISMTLPVWHTGYPIVGDFDGDGHIDLATYDVNHFTFYFQLWDSTTNKWDIQKSVTISNNLLPGGYGVQLGPNTKPVAADMNQDGICDIGLYTPVGTGSLNQSPSDWYWWISSGVPTPGTVVALNHAFSPTPLGNDIFAQMGNNYALPIVGTFDPPATLSAAAASLAATTAPGGLTAKPAAAAAAAAQTSASSAAPTAVPAAAASSSAQATDYALSMFDFGDTTNTLKKTVKQIDVESLLPNVQ